MSTLLSPTLAAVVLAAAAIPAAFAQAFPGKAGRCT